MDEEHVDVYRKLGVEPVVNCGSSRSVYGNSTMSDQVRAAMTSASYNHVIMSELGEAAGHAPASARDLAGDDVEIGRLVEADTGASY